MPNVPDSRRSTGERYTRALDQLTKLGAQKAEAAEPGPEATRSFPGEEQSTEVFARGGTGAGTEEAQRQPNRRAIVPTDGGDSITGMVEGRLADHKNTLVLWIVGTAITTLVAAYFAFSQTADNIRSDVREQTADIRADINTRLSELQQNIRGLEERVRALERIPPR